MSYAVKEAYLTLQGEGAMAGSVQVFCRFAGCNLWSGREEDRAAAACRFCDTSFVGTDGVNGGEFGTAAELARHLLALWPAGASARPGVVFTGGEPLLQLDAALVDACHALGARVAVETNGTVAAPPGVDWLCVSPKPRSELVQRSGHELKLVFPQPELPPSQLEGLAFEHFFLQPMDGASLRQNVAQAVKYCREHPLWRLSLQTHKLIGIP